MYSKIINHNVIIYGFLINIICFFLCVYVEKYVFNRTYIFTTVLYAILFSFIKMIYTRGKSTNIFFGNIIYYLLSLILLITMFFIIAGNISNDYYLNYFLIFISYIFIITINFKNISFVKFKSRYFLFHTFTFILIIYTHSLLGYYKHDFGIPYLLSMWLFLISIYLSIENRATSSLPHE